MSVTVVTSRQLGRALRRGRESITVEGWLARFLVILDVVFRVMEVIGGISLVFAIILYSTVKSDSSYEVWKAASLFLTACGAGVLVADFLTHLAPPFGKYRREKTSDRKVIFTKKTPPDKE